MKQPLDPWQRWLVIHGGELGADGAPRFRELLILVARQNGKSFLLVILALWWMFVECVPLILGTSSKLEYAKEAWGKAVKIVEKSEDLWKYCDPRRYKREGNNEIVLYTKGEDQRYKIAAATDDAGRSLTVDRLILDEFRRHFDWSCYNAAIPTQQAVWDAQAWLITNQGDYRSEPLHSLRRSALAGLESKKGNPTLFIAEWSGEKGADTDLRSRKITDRVVASLAQANPNAGRRLRWDALLAQAQKVIDSGSAEMMNGYIIETLCMEVDQLDPAIDQFAWTECNKGGDLAGLRDRIALVFDISLDGLHVTLTAGARRDDGVTVLDVVKAWDGPNAKAQFRKEFPVLVRKTKPRAIGWFPGGPAAAVAAEMAKRKARPGELAWPPKGISFAELRDDATAACMGFADRVTARQVSHGNDPLQNAHILGADKLEQGERWRFMRRGAGQCDAAYAAAGATHLAQTVTPRRPLGFA
ncbi:MAG TPA: hypothetical protein VK878_23155 [Candidatus Deferrimicrobiaceae bacterium]|nr:hypothetical protein [Candidatus Deferrimicrobiaceae bacterium]